jgi:hypothetical protein
MNKKMKIKTKTSMKINYFYKLEIQRIKEKD